MRSSTNPNRLFANFPGKWAICSHCRGDGGTSEHLGCFTSDEWHDMDDEFKENYIAGRYNQTCQECDGAGKVRTVDVKSCTFAQKRELATWRIEEGWRREERSERMWEARMLGEF